MLNAELTRKLARFGVVGLVVMVLFMALNWLFGRHVGVTMAFLLAYPPALGLHYYLSKRWTFRDQTKTDVQKVTDYLVTVAITFVIQLTAFTAIRHFWAGPSWVAAGAANLVQMAASYLLMQHRVFAQSAASRSSGDKLGALRRWGGGIALALAALATAGFLYWTAVSSRADLKFEGQKIDYYNRLVDGFQAGYLYMKTPEDLSTSSGAVGGPQVARVMLLDTSYYQGHYYLYFGVVPAVLLYWPVAALTGHDLPQSWAALIFAGLAIGFSLAWWREMRRLLCPGLGAKWDWLALLAFSFCTAMPSVLRRPLFYEVAVLAGWTFGALMLWALLRAARSEVRTRWWLGLAGIALGLAVGSRANLAVGGLLALMAGSALVGCHRFGVGKGRWHAAVVAVLWAGLGALLIGSALAAYNYMRFGSIVEFGHSYQTGLNPQHMFRLSNLAHNIPLYYTRPPQIDAYFPFVSPPGETLKPADYVGRESLHGEWMWLWVIVPVLPFLWRSVRRATGPALVVLFPMGLWFAGNFLVTGAAGVRANRYMLDFHPALVALTLGGFALAVAGATKGAWRRSLLLVPLVGAAICFNVLASFEVHGFFEKMDRPRFEQLAKVTNRVIFRLLPGLYDEVGDRAADIEWPAAGRGGVSPLLSTGSMGDDDALWLELDGYSQARLIYQHGEYGMMDGPWFAYRPGAAAHVRVSGAFLLPPVHHDWYGAKTEQTRVALKRRLRVTVDGQTHFDRDVPSFDASPWFFRWGSWQDPNGLIRDCLGRISVQRHLPVDDGWAHNLGDRRGVVRLRLKLPSDRYGQTEPLLQSGTDTRLDLIGLTFSRPGYARLVHDSVGAGATYSPEFPVDYSQWHCVEIESAVTNDGLGWSAHDALQTPLIKGVTIRWNGQVKLTSALPLHPSSMHDIVIGANLVQSSIGRMMYSRDIQTGPFLEPLPPLQEGYVENRKISPDIFQGTQGALFSWQRPDLRIAAVVWRRESPVSPVQLGWLDEGAIRWGSRPLENDRGALRLVMPERMAHLKAGRDSNRGLIDVISDGKLLLSAPTDFFARGAPRGWALDSAGWQGTAISAQPATQTDPGVTGPAPGLPGRIEMRLGVPAGGFTTSVPLLSVGRAGAADSIFIKPLGNHHYAIGHDHWGVGAKTSAPVLILPGKVTALSIEMGSLFADGEFPADQVRVTVDEVCVLDVRGPLYRVKPDEIQIGQNLMGCSTSGPNFPGEIYSLRTQGPLAGRQP